MLVARAPRSPISSMGTGAIHASPMLRKRAPTRSPIENSFRAMRCARCTKRRANELRHQVVRQSESTRRKHDPLAGTDCAAPGYDPIDGVRGSDHVRHPRIRFDLHPQASSGRREIVDELATRQLVSALATPRDDHASIRSGVLGELGEIVRRVRAHHRVERTNRSELIDGIRGMVVERGQHLVLVDRQAQHGIVSTETLPGRANRAM